MSDLAAIFKSVANDMVQAGEKAGRAFITHLKDIGSELRASSGLYRDTENGIKDSIGKIGRTGEQDAARDAGALARDTRGAAASDGKSLTSEEEKALAARGKGADGATDDPVDVVTGEMFLPQEDLALPGVLPLVLGRRHGSAYADGELFGTRWASTLDQHAVTGLHEIRVALEDGRVLHYPVPGDGERVMPSHGPRWPLSWDRESDAVTVEQGDLGQTLHFAARPSAGPRRRLLAVTDRAGNEITFTYGDDGVINGVRHSGGYHVKVGTRVTLGGVRVSSLALADPDGGDDIVVREFRYSLSGHLTGVVNASGLPLLFEYDSEGRITRWEDRNGYEYRYTYRSDGRVVRGEGTGGFLNVALDYDLDARTTTVTDALGHETVHHWNDRFQVVRVVNPLGHETRTEKDEYGYLAAQADALGRITRIERDELGDPVGIRRPDGTRLAMSYTPERQPSAITGPDGAVWRYEYGEHGYLAAEQDPAGAVARYGRDEHGRPTSVTDPLGATSAITCDEAGLPIRVTDPLGSACDIQRDAFGRIIAVTEPHGATTRLSWTVDGQLTERHYPDGTDERWEYDAEGNLVAHTGPHGAVARYEYGPFDQVTTRTDPNGVQYRFEYDSCLKLTKVTGPSGREWHYAYDSAGNLLSETDFDGGTRYYEYDAAGQLVRSRNAADEETTYVHDALGRVTERQAGEARYRYAYDAAGNISSAVGPDATLKYTRDALGRILTESINGRILANTFDANGQRVTRTTPAGLTSIWSFDAAGKPAELVTGEGRLAFSYDATGRETERAIGLRARVTQTFDELSRLTGQSIWAGDQPGTGPENWRATQTRTYSYRADGLPLEIDDALRGRRSLDLDPNGRVTRVTGANWRESYAYDALGNLTSARSASDEDNAEREVDGTRIRRAGRTRYDYDAAGRLIRKQRRTLSGKVREWTYSWDAEDCLRQVTTPDGATWHYAYDPLGRRIEKRSVGADGTTAQSVTFSWDGLRLAEESTHSADGTTTTLAWDYQPGTFTAVTQTRHSRPDSTSQEAIDAEFYAIVTDMAGTPTELVGLDGEVAWHTITDIWGGTIDAPDSTADCPLRFPGQYFDPETGLHYNQQRYYDPDTASYLSPDPLGLEPSPNPHAYVENPLGWIDPIGLTPCRYDTGNGPTPTQDPWDDLAKFRQKSGMPAVGSAADKHTAARLDVDGESFYGRNGHGMPTDIKVNAQTRTHAEGQAFQRAKNFFTGQSGRAVPKEATLYVDRDFCDSCGRRGGVGSLMRGLGIDRLTVHFPSGTSIIDATRRPSVPKPA